MAAALPDSRASDDQNGLMDVRPRLLMAAYYTQTVPSSSAVCALLHVMQSRLTLASAIMLTAACSLQLSRR